MVKLQTNGLAKKKQVLNFFYVLDRAIIIMSLSNPFTAAGMKREGGTLLKLI